MALGGVALALLVTLALLGARAWSRRRDRNAAAHGRVELIDPRELLFSLPTIHGGLPPVESEPGLGAKRDAALLNEDDWRQEEFVAAASIPYVERALGEIRSHRAAHAVGLGFRDVYAREEPPVSLATTGLTLDEVSRALRSKPMPLYLAGGRARVAGGFAVAVPNVGFVYGREQDGSVQAFGLRLVGPGWGDLGDLAALCARFDLYFVDWLRLETFWAGDPDALRAWVEHATGGDSAPAT
jgi:hypothetical protein